MFTFRKMAVFFLMKMMSIAMGVYSSADESDIGRVRSILSS